MSSSKLKPPKLIYRVQFEIFWTENNPLYGTSRFRFNLDMIQIKGALLRLSKLYMILAHPSLVARLSASMCALLIKNH